MTVASLFKTTTSVASPLDGSAGAAAGGSGTTSVSDFLTVQALTNFAAMTGAITAAWHALSTLSAPLFSGLWVPYAFAGAFGLVSILISTDGLTTAGKVDFGKAGGAIFVAVINSLVLAGAVIGTTIAVAAPSP